MSSAKTISDIIAFAEVIDSKSFIGNPFTSQPLYIAACAFLMEIAAHTSSHPSSRTTSPPPPRGGNSGSTANNESKSNAANPKHSLLATAANQNYQRCYKALQQLEVYWGGAKYILTALDQKSKGIWDPETFTSEEMESTRLPRPEIPNGWRRKVSLGFPPQLPYNRTAGRSPRSIPGSPMIDPSQAIGWSLTGTTNSPSSNLTLLYQSMAGDHHSAPHAPTGNMIYDPIRQSLPEGSRATTSTSNLLQNYNHSNDPNSGYAVKHRTSMHQMPPPAPKYTPVSNDPASTSDAEMLLGLQNSPYAHTPTNSHNSHNSYENTHSMASPSTSTMRHEPSLSSYDFSHNSPGMSFPSGANGYMGLGGGFGDMMMESQEIDMSTLGGDMMPWLEYLPQDVLNFFDNNGNINGSGPDGVNMAIMGGGDGNN